MNRRLSKVSGSRRLRAKLGALGAVASILGGLVAVQVTATPMADASTYVGGSVLCLDNSPVEGVWIQAASGGSGWANFGPVGAADVSFNYALPYGSSYTVHVGCGGSRSNWRYTPNGNRYVSWSTTDWTCFTPDVTNSYYCMAQDG